MKLQIPQTISNSSTLEEVIRFASNSIDKIKSIVNGNVDLIENSPNQLIDFTFTSANTDVGVTHSLGRTPRGYIQTSSSSTALIIANGNASNTSSTLYLQSNGAGTVTVMVF